MSLVTALVCHSSTVTALVCHSSTNKQLTALCTFSNVTCAKESTSVTSENNACKVQQVNIQTDNVYIQGLTMCT